MTDPSQADIHAEGQVPDNDAMCRGLDNHAEGHAQHQTQTTTWNASSDPFKPPTSSDSHERLEYYYFKHLELDALVAQNSAILNLGLSHYDPSVDKGVPEDLWDNSTENPRIPQYEAELQGLVSAMNYPAVSNAAMMEFVARSLRPPYHASGSSSNDSTGHTTTTQESAQVQVAKATDEETCPSQRPPASKKPRVAFLIND
ncbi:hypothetical protein C1H76_2652 [Elsinoe australis]|uniref:Uncharacterized protein n=1 Tax=Elsinoe australis TaxID=40998 RepID=A0A4U7B8D1_9PEZI|nr:hypothetical protein C1H76_2652 [Elsinoe australis]